MTAPAMSHVERSERPSQRVMTPLKCAYCGRRYMHDGRTPLAFDLRYARCIGKSASPEPRVCGGALEINVLRILGVE